MAVLAALLAFAVGLTLAPSGAATLRKPARPSHAKKHVKAKPKKKHAAVRAASDAAGNLLKNPSF